MTYQHGDRVVRVACRALPDYGIPHGIDNDVSSALIDHFMSIGLPDDGEMILAVSELMQLANFHRNGKYRDMLAVSLDRLHTSGVGKPATLLVKSNAAPKGAVITRLKSVYERRIKTQVLSGVA
ncbi:replication initiator protein A [Deinococcus oregonensis]|uniref:Replication initiator protein A n=1 Tax=Deinococcus oregonensis TaxID=1805970 RepID=A0ABV6AW98_9DEIO